MTRFFARALVIAFIPMLFLFSGCDKAAYEVPSSSDSQSTAQTVDQIPLSELQGVWEIGTYTVTEVNIPDEIRKKAESEKNSTSSDPSGCSYEIIQALDQMKGNPIPSKIGIFPIDDKSGYLAITMQQGDTPPDEPTKPESEEDKKKDFFTYSNNILSVNSTDGGYDYSITLTASKGTVYKLNGTTRVEAEAGMATISIALSYTK